MPTRHSPAKINLTLAVLGTRPDGFHVLESLVALLEFGDTIDFTPRTDDQLDLACPHPDVPADGSNLILRAAERLREVAGRQCGVDIKLDKRIPPGSGLGGGSSNAATTLAALNEIWELGLSSEQLSGIAAELGSDVPLFLRGPLSIIRGRGEMVQPVRQLFDA
ncbi:MAG: 4-(cytidine 5'-diphospho)-2-C-methyl-D-erythritol kinase, partial [Phycisphaerae bacterium]|nr:4-(cytidine 5'-diphospho)-2-C-methyl-D-erythritol kinase [Phycisphaerae bacterium]